MKITAIILAAGKSSRMAPLFKLTQMVDGQAMVRCTVQQVLDCAIDRAIVITGHRGDEIRSVLAGLDVDFVDNPDFEKGISTSIRAGIQAAGKSCDGVLIVLADMPIVSTGDYDRIISAFTGKSCICIPTCKNRPGNPVLWGAQFFPQLANLSGDKGGKQIMTGLDEFICKVGMDSNSVLLDFDVKSAVDL